MKCNKLLFEWWGASGEVLSIAHNKNIEDIVMSQVRPLRDIPTDVD